MKISLLAQKPLADSLFDSECMEKLLQLGEVTQNEDLKAPNKERVKELIKEADIAITSWGTPSLDKDILDTAPNLKLIIHAAGSVKPIMSDQIFPRGIRVVSCANAIGIGVAETALGLTIISVKNVKELDTDIHNGEWAKNKMKTKEMYGINIGVVGAGWVGRHFIKLLKNFHVNILLYDPFVSEEQAKELGVKKVELDELMRSSEVVSLHAPSLPATNKMINRSNLKLMKDGATLINTARGSLIDEEALYEECKTGRIKACLDVTDPEPPAVDHPFRTLPNIIMTPHIAGAVTNGRFRIGLYTVQAIESFINREPILGEVKEEQLATIA
ncbi:MAG: hydroxyacid dehydrogenase [Clostridia bacterium]